MQFGEIGNPTYIALETFRKSGEGVVTPVWVTTEGDKPYVWTVDDSGKVKRIRNNGCVRVAVSDTLAPKRERASSMGRLTSTRNSSVWPPNMAGNSTCSTS